MYYKPEVLVLGSIRFLLGTGRGQAASGLQEAASSCTEARSASSQFSKTRFLFNYTGQGRAVLHSDELPPESQANYRPSHRPITVRAPGPALWSAGVAGLIPDLAGL
jgi:hypothetical protein